MDFSELDGSNQSHYRTRTIAAPNACIYRHKAKFANAIAELLNNVFLTGGCSFHEDIQDCRWHSRRGSESSGSIVNNVPDRVLQLLYNNGDTSISGVERWFEAFANALTNKFRSEYGSTGGMQPMRYYNLCPLILPTA